MHLGGADLCRGVLMKIAIWSIFDLEKVVGIREAWIYS